MQWNSFQNILDETVKPLFWEGKHSMQLQNNTTANFDGLLIVHLSIFILVINQLDAQNLFYNKFIWCLYMFWPPCAHCQEVKIVLCSLWYHHTETSEWSKITKIDHSLVSVWWYQRLYNTILPSWRWAHVLETCRGLK